MNFLAQLYPALSLLSSGGEIEREIPIWKDREYCGWKLEMKVLIIFCISQTICCLSWFSWPCNQRKEQLRWYLPFLSSYRTDRQLHWRCCQSGIIFFSEAWWELLCYRLQWAFFCFIWSRTTRVFQGMTSSQVCKLG